jgi:hypothetical protein
MKLSTFVCCFLLLTFGVISGNARTVAECKAQCFVDWADSLVGLKNCKKGCVDNPDCVGAECCFSAHSTVVISQGIQKTMSDVKIGDEIRVMDPATGKLTFSPVITFLDRKPSHDTYFHLITTETGEKLTVTPLHLVYSYSAIELQNEIIQEDQIDFNLFKAIYAKNISVGDLVLVSQTNKAGQLNPTRVSKIETQMHKGAYSPLTEMGNIVFFFLIFFNFFQFFFSIFFGKIVVDNILASCYASFDSHWVAHKAFSPIRLLAKVWLNDQLVDGIHWYAQSLQSLQSLIGFVMPSVLPTSPAT